jgi:hypothetical protein
MGKRLGIIGAVIAVVALVVGAISPALGITESRVRVGIIRPRGQTADDPRACRVHGV